MEAPSNQLPTPAHLRDISSDAADRIVDKFASLLGTKTSASKDGKDAVSLGHMDRSKALLSLLSDGADDDAVVLTLPSLAMRLAETNAALPKIGETQGGGGVDGSPSPASSGGAGGADVNSSPLVSRPHMAASVLTSASNDAAAVEQKAVTTISKNTSWTRSTVMYAAHAVASNASEFFTNLIDSRLRSWTLLLLRHSLSTGNQESRSRLLNMLSASIKVEKTETTFKTLTLPASARGQPMEADVILPLLLEVSLHVSIQDNKETIVVRAPGTISAYLANSHSLKKVLIRLDTGVLLSSMVDQARLVVFKAVAHATKASIPASLATAGTVDGDTKAGLGAGAGGLSERVASHVLNPVGGSPSSGNSSTDSGLTDGSNVSRVSNLAGFRSALNLSTAQADKLPPSLQKARSSALRLSSVLYGSNNKSSGGGDANNKSGLASTLGQRRNRSIKWDSPLQLPRLANQDPSPDSKKQCMADNAAKLKSFKSFGRPHAGVFGSGPRNATFGEYSRAHMWGRDGRLAHHPVPMQQVLAQNQLGGGPVAPDRNATFDFASALKRNNGSRSNLGGPSMPRTATVLEKLLMKTTSGKGF